MEAPSLGAELELQLWAYTTAPATWDPNASVTHTTAHRNARSFNLLSEARDPTRVLMDTSWARFH